MTARDLCRAARRITVRGECRAGGRRARGARRWRACCSSRRRIEVPLEPRTVPRRGCRSLPRRPDRHDARTSTHLPADAHPEGRRGSRRPRRLHDEPRPRSACGGRCSGASPRKSFAARIDRCCWSDDTAATDFLTPRYARARVRRRAPRAQAGSRPFARRMGRAARTPDRRRGGRPSARCRDHVDPPGGARSIRSSRPSAARPGVTPIC